MWLCLVMPVPDHRVAAASRATDALWPAVLAHQGEALRVVEQGCEVDWVHCGHDDRNPSCSPATADRLEPSSYPNPPSRASVTPEADKSLGSLLRTLAVLCTQQRCSRVVGHSSPSAFQKPSAPSATASSGAMSRPRLFKSSSSSRQSWALSRAPSVKPSSSFLPSGVAPMMTRMHCLASSRRACR